jgi:hypothetical protein
MTSNKIVGWFLLTLGAPLCLGILVFFTGASIWGIIWESQPVTSFDMKISLAVFIVVALSLTIATAWKGLSLIRAERKTLLENVGWLLLIMGAIGVSCSIAGIVAVHPFYTVAFLVNLMAIFWGRNLINPLDWSKFHLYSGWFLFTAVAGALIYGLLVSIGEFLNWSISVGVGEKYQGFYIITLCVLFPWVVAIETWWLRSIIKRKRLTNDITLP